MQRVSEGGANESARIEVQPRRVERGSATSPSLHGGDHDRFVVGGDRGHGRRTDVVDVYFLEGDAAFDSRIVVDAVAAAVVEAASRVGLGFVLSLHHDNIYYKGVVLLRGGSVATVLDL